MRQKVEKAILKSLASRLSGSFEKSEQEFSRVDHSVVFSRALGDGEITIDIVLRFLRPHVLTLDAWMRVVHKEVDALLIENGLLNTQFTSIPIIHRGIEDVFAGGMRNGKFYLEHEGKGLEGIDVEQTAEKIYSRYFKYVLTTLEPTIDSLGKLHALVNNDVNLQGERVVPSIYNSPLQNQILTGVALAILVKPAMYHAIMSTYRNFVNKLLQSMQDERVDLAQLLIAKYAPA